MISITSCNVTVRNADILDMTLFQTEDYRGFVKAHVAALPKKGHGELSKIARAIGVHQTLLSLVLGGERDLTLEQAHDLANYLGLTELESEYFSLLVQFARAGNPRYKSAVREKIEKIRADSMKISKRVKHGKVLSDQQRAIHYSSWIYSAVRLFASTEPNGKSLEQIQERFHLTRQRALEVLSFLESCELVVKVGELYLMGKQRTFLEHGSPHLLKHHSNWRIKVLEQADQISESELMFTSPVSLSKKDFAALRERTAGFIAEFLKTVEASPAEELACINIDFVKLR